MKKYYNLKIDLNSHEKFWEWLSENPNAIFLLENNLEKIYWPALSLNPNAIHILEANTDKIDWQRLSGLKIYIDSF